MVSKCARTHVRDAFASKSAAKVQIFFDICKYFSIIRKKIMQILADLNNFDGTDTASRPTLNLHSYLA